MSCLESITNLIYICFSLGRYTCRLAGYIEPLATQIYTFKELDQFQRFVRNNIFDFDVTQSIKHALATAKVNSQWQANNYKTIVRVLNDFTGDK